MSNTPYKGKPGPGSCAVCNSEHKDAIEAALVAGLSYAAIGDRYDVQHKSVSRHSREHMTSAQRAAIMTATAPGDVDFETLANVENGSILATMKARRMRLAHDANTARDAGDPGTAARCEMAAQGIDEAIARMVGRLATNINVKHQHLHLTPQYVEHTRAILAAVKPYPEAARAIAAALRALDDKAALQIAPPAKAPVIEATFTELPPTRTKISPPPY